MSFLDDIKHPPHVEPPQRPVTILDMDRTACTPDMMEPMADPCPVCGGFCMAVGDWVCWGACYRCYKVLAEGEGRE